METGPGLETERLNTSLQHTTCGNVIEEAFTPLHLEPKWQHASALVQGIAAELTAQPESGHVIYKKRCRKKTQDMDTPARLNKMWTRQHAAAVVAD